MNIDEECLCKHMDDNRNEIDLFQWNLLIFHKMLEQRGEKFGWFENCTIILSLLFSFSFTKDMKLKCLHDKIVQLLHRNIEKNNSIRNISRSDLFVSLYVRVQLIRSISSFQWNNCWLCKRKAHRLAETIRRCENTHSRWAKHSSRLLISLFSFQWKQYDVEIECTK